MRSEYFEVVSVLIQRKHLPGSMVANLDALRNLTDGSVLFILYIKPDTYQWVFHFTIRKNMTCQDILWSFAPLLYIITKTWMDILTNFNDLKLGWINLSDNVKLAVWLSILFSHNFDIKGEVHVSLMLKNKWNNPLVCLLQRSVC